MRFRLYPTPAQEIEMAERCSHARFIWNLALEQFNLYRPAFGPTPRHLERSRQLTEARAASDWLDAGTRMVQQQALRDLDQALQNWWNGTHGRPTWRKAGIHEGFQVVGADAARVEKLNRKWSQVRIPKLGWVKLRRTRELRTWKSYRIKRDRAGRWWICFAVIPDPIPAPGDGSIVGIDRGIAATMALSSGETMHMPVSSAMRRERRLRLERQLARGVMGSNRRKVARTRLARFHAHDAAARKDFVEKATTDIARRFDLIRIEDLGVDRMLKSARGTIKNPGRNVAQKAGLNGSILQQCWGMIDKRLHDKARDRVEKVNPAFTSQRCSSCGHIDPKSRESQARFRCTRCAHTANADVNAAINIAARHAVAGRGDISKGTPDSSGAALSAKRQPQLAPCGPLESSPISGGEDAESELGELDLFTHGGCLRFPAGLRVM